MAKKKKGPAPEGWQDAVDASQQLDGTGVTIEGGGPVVTVKLSEDQHRAVGDELAATLLQIEERKAEKKRVTKEFKDDIAVLEERRDILRDEWRSGVRKEDAQASLPGMEDTPA